ncbi:MAG: methyltransferase, partial [Planctomycetota bacterium]
GKAMVPFLTDGPESALGMMRHHAQLWEAWGGMTEVVRTGEAADRGPSFRRGKEDARRFTFAMRDGAIRFAPAVAEELDLGDCRHLYDLGGGPGVYSVEIARRHPDLKVTVLDLPNVVEVGREIVAEYGDVADRVRFHACDLSNDALPKGADAALLSHVIHGEPEEGVRSMFAKVAAILPRGGLFIVRDFFLSPDRTQPPDASLFSMNMLVATRGGRSYSAQECEGWLRKVGFATVTYRKSKAAPDTGYLFARR